MVRIYVPSTLSGLATALGSGSVPAGPGYAVTPALREWYAAGSDEELEYAALTQAARASLELLASAGSASSAGSAGSAGSSGSSGSARRVVVVVEAEPERSVAAEPGDAEVRLAAAVPWVKVAAVHVDAVEAAEVVLAALEVWEAARKGDEDALFAVEACEGEELLWYATQEVPDLLTEVGVPVDGPTQRS